MEEDNKTLSPYVAPGLLTHKYTLETAANILFEELHTSLEELRQKTRKKEIRSKRQICMYLLDWYGNWTQNQIGLLFRKDHATVIHSCRVVTNDMLTDKKLKDFCIRLMHTKLRKE